MVNRNAGKDENFSPHLTSDGVEAAKGLEVQQTSESGRNENDEQVM